MIVTIEEGRKKYKEFYKRQIRRYKKCMEKYGTDKVQEFPAETHMNFLKAFQEMKGMEKVLCLTKKEKEIIRKEIKNEIGF